MYKFKMGQEVIMTDDMGDTFHGTIHSYTGLEGGTNAYYVYSLEWCPKGTIDVWPEDALMLVKKSKSN